MARPRKKIPAYLLHNKSGNARVRIRVNGRYRDFYLGEYGSPESLDRYKQLIAEHCGDDYASREEALASLPAPGDADWTIAELVLKYDEFASSYYVKNGEPTNDRYRAAITPLVTLYGDSLAKNFGPKKLKTLRETIIAQGKVKSAEFDEHGNLTKSGEPLSRDYVNNLIKALVRMFRWGVTEEKVPPSVPQALREVGGLRKGRDPRLREPEKLKPVPEDDFWAVVAVASPHIATMLQVQRLTGMRPDEVTILRPCDIDRSGEVWSFKPGNHKTEWLDQEKEILLGPKAQELLEPWIEKRTPEQYLFSPREAAQSNATNLEKRRRIPSKKKVPLSKARPPCEHYDDRGYRQAVVRACRRANVSAWLPGRIRHSAGTEIRKKYGAEAAQVVLGHRNLSTTEIYAEKNREKYEAIMKEVG